MLRFALPLTITVSSSFPDLIGFVFYHFIVDLTEVTTQRLRRENSESYPQQPYKKTENLSCSGVNAQMYSSEQ